MDSRMRQRNNKKNKKRSNETYFDYSLLFIVIFLLCFGLVMLYSASSYEASMEIGSSTFYLKKQLFACILGVITLAIMLRFDYHILQKPIVALTSYFGSVFALLLIKTPIGFSVNGARRWLNLKVITLQPSEISKLGLIIFMAFFINKNTKNLKKLSTFFVCLIYIGIIAFLVAGMTSDLSSGVIIAGIGVVMLFVACPKERYLIVCGIVGLVGFAGALIAEPYRIERFKVWLSPEKYSSSGAYQIMQSLYALGSGGLFGKGLGKGIQKLGYVPEAQNDMIFTVICEELGVIGGLSVIALFVFMIWRFMIISNNAPDLFGSLLVIGVMAHISIQTVMNIAVVTNSMPNTGVTLPFISYGGTSILFLLMEVGLVLCVSKRIRFE